MCVCVCDRAPNPITRHRYRKYNGRTFIELSVYRIEASNMDDADGAWLQGFLNYCDRLLPTLPSHGACPRPSDYTPRFLV